MQKTLTIENIFDKYQVRETTAILIFTMLVPILVHLIPSNGLPMGARLLPFYFAPFVAVFFFRYSTALTAVLLAPVLNNLITGNPQQGILPLLILQLVLFITFTSLLKSYNSIKYITAPISFVLSFIIIYVLSLLIPSLIGKVSFLNTIWNGLPGLVILLGINILCVKLVKFIENK